MQNALKTFATVKWILIIINTLRKGLVFSIKGAFIIWIFTYAKKTQK